MPLRRRLSIIAAASVGIAILAASVICYLVVRNQLLGQVTTSLKTQAQAVQRHGPSALASTFEGVPPSAGGPAQYQQVVLYNGRTAAGGQAGDLQLPITPRVLRVAAGKEGQFLYEFHIGSSHLAEVVVPFELQIQGGFGMTTVNAAVQLARPLNGVDSVLANLRLVLALVLVGGVFVAGMLGRIASRRVLKPLKEVEQTAQHIAETDDLSNRIRVRADDEVGRLASRFNQMLDRVQGSRAALDDSVRAQRQLVADASHELRTPVTSLRTNIEILLETGDLDPEMRRAMLTDVVEQSEELASLVNDLIELARGDEPGADTDDVRLDWIAEEALARAHRNAPGLQFEATIEPALLDGVPERLGRAVNNLLDNATRHSPAAGTIELYAGPGGIRVRDHGDGVDEADLPYLFDRFYRGTNSRGRQGSGLGLAIVRQVTEQHGGTASVVNAPDGGAVFTLSLPAVTPEDHDPTAEHDPAASDSDASATDQPAATPRRSHPLRIS